MSTGIETWNMNLLDIGPIYPFTGTELLLVVIGVVSWIIWHVIQFRAENELYDEEERSYSDQEKLKTAMAISNAETLYEAAKDNGENLK